MSRATALLLSTAAFAQVPVTDGANTAINDKIKALTSQIQSDTAIIKDNTTKTLQAITGDRTQDAGQFSSLATGGGFTMSQAPDFGAILQGNQASFGGIGGQFQNLAAQGINGLNLVKMVKDAVTGGELTGANQAYNQGVQTLTALTAMTDAMNAASKERTNAFTNAAGEVGKAQDMKGALVRGTQDGLNLLLGIMAALIVFVAIVALINLAVEPLTGFTLQRAMGWVLWPVAWAMGIPPAEAATVGASLGVKMIVNEFVSYLELAQSGGAGLSERSRLILTYALCGFTNLGSVGIMVGGMSAMCPERRTDIVKLGLPALVSGTIACCMTGAVVGVLAAP